MTSEAQLLSSEIDGLDRQIIHAIQLHPRAAYALIAQALDVSEQTVARRYRRLESGGLLRVFGLISPEALGFERWILRIQCRPDAAGALADALARRGDVNWVSLSAGGSEIIGMTRTRQDLNARDLLLHRLPRTAEVSSLSAFSILHQFDAAKEWSGYGGDLGPDQVALLTRDVIERGGHESGVLERGPGPGSITSADDTALLAVLARDGRASLRRLAGATGWSATRVARRLESLQSAGALYFDVDLDVERLGFRTAAMLWLTVAPSDLADVGEALIGHEEVAFCAAVTGSACLIASVLTRNSADLYRYLTTRVGALAAVREIETSPLVRRVKQAGSILTATGIARPAVTSR